MLMIHTNRVIFMILLLLFVPVVYEMSFFHFISDVYAEPADRNYLSSNIYSADYID